VVRGSASEGSKVGFDIRYVEGDRRDQVRARDARIDTTGTMPMLFMGSRIAAGDARAQLTDFAPAVVD
jgi:hypothetical protein